MNKKTVVWVVSLAVFTCYLLVLSYLLFFSSEFRFVSDRHGMNLVPFREILRYKDAPLSYGCIVNVYGNILAFIPFGFMILPITRNRLLLPFAFASCLGITLLAETIQWLTHVGVFDVDDLILNFLGGAIGIGLYKLVELLIGTIAGRVKSR